MKPYSYEGKRHTNLVTVSKWGRTSLSGLRRRPSRRRQATLVSARRVTTHRARAAAKAAIREQRTVRALETA